MLRVPNIVATMLGVFALGLPLRPYALLPGQPYYDYYNPINRPPQLLDSVRINHLERAEAVLRTKDPNRLEGAAGDLRYVLDYFPNHPQALSMMVNVALEWKKPQLIEKFLADAIDTFPNTASTWTIQGIYLARIGKTDRAIESYQRALSLKPDDMQTHYDIGLAYASKKQWDLANEHAQVAYRLGAPFPGLKQMLVKAGAWKRAAGAEGGAGAPSTNQGSESSQQPEAPLLDRKR